jgi:predicted PolB exonuclease-like 3'-5' exonuclease
MWIVIDIETILDDSLPPQEDPTKFPSTPHHKVLCIGALALDSNYEVKKLGLISGLTESEILTNFVNLAIERKPTFVTFNGRGFDLPVIASRCFSHGITFRYYYALREVRYRYSTEGHFDLMDYLADFGSTKVSKLDVMAKLCGMPGKLGITGDNVASMPLEETQNYCLSDVVQTAGVLLRTQLLRGIIEKEQYVVAAQKLLDFIKDDNRVRTTYEAINKEKFLLTS